ncbi:hypothetical protein AHF37_07589 [Paragonimus kellicotti]|nr:hypothetical protein AHF37_07589 [Paragonimus kellicotti]
MLLVSSVKPNLVAYDFLYVSLFGFSSISLGLFVIFLVGLDAAGKTTILYKLKFGEISYQPSPTIGFNVRNGRVQRISVSLSGMSVDKIRSVVYGDTISRIHRLVSRYCKNSIVHLI